MNLFALSGLLVGLSSLGFGYFVYHKGRTKIANRVWFIFCLSVAFWGFGGMLIALAKTPTEAIWAWRASFAFGVLWIPVLFYRFIHIFCSLSDRKLLYGSYCTAILFFPLIFTDVFFSGVRYSFSSFYYSTPGWLFPIFVFWWMGIIIYSHYELFRTLRKSEGQKTTQIIYFFIATAIGYTGGSLDYLPIFNVDLYPYGNFAIILYPVIMTYAILKYRLMDITVVVNKGLSYVALLSIIVIPIYLIAFIGKYATLYSFPVLLSATLVLACGLWILLRKPTNLSNILFFLICLSVCTWLFSIFMIYSSMHSSDVYFWTNITYIGIILIPPFFYHFSSCMEPFKTNKLIVFFYTASGFFLLLIPTSYLTNGYYDFFWGSYPKAGPLHPLFLGYFGLTSVIALYKLYEGHKYAQNSLIENITPKSLFWPFVLGYIACIDFIPSYGVEIYPVGYIFVTVWIMSVSYAILKSYILVSPFDVRTRFIPYLQILVLASCLYLVTLLIIRLFIGRTEYMLAGLLIVIFSIFAGRFDFLRRHTEKAVEKVLFRERFDAYETLTAFSKSLVSILDLRKLAEEIVHTLARVLQTHNAFLFLVDQEKDTYDLAASYGTFTVPSNLEHLAASDALLRHLALVQAVLVREEIEQGHFSQETPRIVQTMRSLRAEVCLPLVNKGRLIGFCTLGSRLSFRMFSHEDLNLLQSLAHNAAIALDNAMLYEQWKRSQALMRRTDRLRSLETIAAGFAHEVRNPLTSVKTFVQLAPQRKEDAEFMEQFSGIVCEDVARIERLIEEILDYARYMEPKFNTEDLNGIISSCLYFIGVKADHHRITIEKDLSKTLPPAKLDRQQIKQVLLNLLMNALEAMEGSGGHLTVRTHKLEKQDDTWLQIEISDTGCGISGSDLEHIFDPFHTTKHASSEREGTGLGLAIVHQIVHEHGGYIDVRSEIGRGTTFWVNLPSDPPPPHRLQLEKVEQASPSSHG